MFFFDHGFPTRVANVGGVSGIATRVEVCLGHRDDPFYAFQRPKSSGPNPIFVNTKMDLFEALSFILARYGSAKKEVFTAH
jgi:hypothetical protein